MVLRTVVTFTLSKHNLFAIFAQRVLHFEVESIGSFILMLSQ